MASEFIGYNVLVSLRVPPNAQLRGVVANVVGQRLMLRDVTLLWSGQYVPTYSVEAPDIADLSLESLHRGPSAPQGQYASHTSQPAPSGTSQTATPQSFVDPAILSFAKPPARHDGPVPRSGSIPSSRGSAVQAPVASHNVSQTYTAATATLTEPFSNLGLAPKQVPSVTDAVSQSELDGSVPAENPEPPSLQSAMRHAGRKGRRAGQGKLETGVGNGNTAALNTDPKARGWRQTAFVEPSQPKTFQLPHTYNEDNAQANDRRRKRKSRRTYGEDTNGWATEDATDIQEMGEFDFQSNLSKFDKRRVFEEIRNDDTTADEARLVYFNRKAKPGTNGGKNLHWTENVLDSPRNSDAGDTDEHASDAKLSSANHSGLDRSRATARTQGSRKGSGVLAQSLIATQIRTQLSTSRTSSPRPGKPLVSASPVNGPTGGTGGSLRLITTNRSCPTVSPLQTLEVEQLAVTELGLTEDIITENAGRGIAEAAVSMVSNDSAAPTVLLLTGNHRTGARAVAAARHLRNRGHRVTLCMLGLEHESELLDSCRKQLDIFRKIGGRVLKWEELSARISTAEFGPDLVIDALFGMHVAFDDLRTEMQAIAFEMISWMNRSNLEALSVDVPSGLSASNGEVTIVEEGRLCVASKAVVCLGAPKTGISHALVSGEGSSWKISVADIGIPQVVWRKYGTRRRHGIDFGNRWLVPLRFQPSST